MSLSGRTPLLRQRCDGEVFKLLLELAHERTRAGFGKFTRLHRLGDDWNHKRVYRIYCGLKLNKRRRAKSVWLHLYQSNKADGDGVEDTESITAQP